MLLCQLTWLTKMVQAFWWYMITHGMQTKFNVQNSECITYWYHLVYIHWMNNLISLVYFSVPIKSQCCIHSFIITKDSIQIFMAIDSLCSRCQIYLDVGDHYYITSVIFTFTPIFLDNVSISNEGTDQCYYIFIKGLHVWFCFILINARIVNQTWPFYISCE